MQNVGIVDPTNPPEIELTPELIQLQAELLAEQNKPKVYSKVQFLSVPEEYRHDYPELFLVQKSTKVEI